MPMHLARLTPILAAALLILASCASSHRSGMPARIRQEQRNQQLVVTFYDELFNKHDVSALQRYVVEGYIQHNPMAATGRQPVIDLFGGFFQRFPEYRADIKRVAAHGDLVWLHVHTRRNAQDRGTAVVDIFRVQDGKIVEHWDVVQPVPDKSANDNTMF